MIFMCKIICVLACSPYELREKDLWTILVVMDIVKYNLLVSSVKTFVTSLTSCYWLSQVGVSYVFYSGDTHRYTNLIFIILFCLLKMKSKNRIFSHTNNCSVCLWCAVLNCSMWSKLLVALKHIRWALNSSLTVT